MDPIPGSKHDHKDTQPKTAVEEAMLCISKALEHAMIEAKQLSWFSFGKRAYMKGVVMALTLSLGLLHELYHKYDNSHGGWN